MHAAFSVPTLLILLRFSPKKEDRGKEPPKFAELYRLVVHDVDVLVSFARVDLSVLWEVLLWGDCCCRYMGSGGRVLECRLGLVEVQICCVDRWCDVCR